MITILVFLLILGFPPRAIGIYKNKSNKWKIVRGDKEVEASDTIYSLNWFPIGGFVRIKGENGEGQKDKDSFASKGAWTRIKVLGAGIFMNAFFAWVLLSMAYMFGTPQAVEQFEPGAEILINQVEENSPASKMGVKAGDVILDAQQNGNKIQFKAVKEVQDFIKASAGKEISFDIRRGKEELSLKGTPREKAEEGKGLLGIGLAQVIVKKEGIINSLWLGLQETGAMFLIILDVVKKMLLGNREVLGSVTGVVGVAVFTGQIIPLGIAHLLRFIAMFSVNLAIINALPFPALDGGRILFVLIEKIKGSPVNQKVEQVFHTIGFALLMILMVVITWRDFIRYDIIDKIKGIF